MKPIIVFVFSILAPMMSAGQNSYENVPSNYESGTIFFKSVPIIQQRTFHLNGGNKARLGGGKSRVYLQIELPPNTVEWYYSFATSGNEKCNENLNLALQLSSIISSFYLHPLSGLFSASGLSQSAKASIKIPLGSHAVDIYLFDSVNLAKFLERNPFEPVMEGSTENTTQGLISIRNCDTGIFYLGIRNPAMVYSADVTIEVVAITKE
jgi:hypothetical protein